MTKANPIPPALRKSLLEALVPDVKDQQNVTARDIDTFADYVLGELGQTTATFTSILSSTYKPYQPPGERILWLLTAVATPLAESANSSLDKITEVLISGTVIAEECRDGDRRVHAVRSIFWLLGWLTFFYRPNIGHGTGLDIELQDCSCFTGQSQEIEESSRPFFEIVNVFNALGDLKTSDTSSMTSSRDSRQAVRQAFLHPSHFNASVLTKFGNLDVVWVDSIGSHLDLDIASKKLFLFRMPSFLRTQSFAGSLLPASFSRYEKGRESGSTCDLVSLAHEVLDTYSLFFNNDRKSRSVYRKLRGTASAGGNIDPLLDELCGFTKGRWISIDLAPPQPSIDVDLSFPILATRMLRLQQYIQGQGVRGLRALYRDQRDSYQWWTFWAVVWIGGLNLLFAFTQNVLGCLQVAYAIKAMKA